MSSADWPGDLGRVSDGSWEVLHADWPAYPGDLGWKLPLLRLGDFPVGTTFTCLAVIDQCALFVAEVGIREPDQFSEKHMHVAVRLAELLELDHRGLVTGVELDTSLSPEQIQMKRTLGPTMWEDFRAGRVELGTRIDGEFLPIPMPADEEPWEEWESDSVYPPMRSPERVAMFPGTAVQLSPIGPREVEHLAREMLEIPSSVEQRIASLLAAELFDSAIRDLGAALEMRMRVFAGVDGFGQGLIESYIQALIARDACLPARAKALRQELRAVFKFVRNEFAHQIIDLDASRGYALISRLCWHVRDVELLIDEYDVGS